MRLLSAVDDVLPVLQCGLCEHFHRNVRSLVELLENSKTDLTGFKRSITYIPKLLCFTVCFKVFLVPVNTYKMEDYFFMRKRLLKPNAPQILAPCEDKNLDNAVMAKNSIIRRLGEY